MNTTPIEWTRTYHPDGTWTPGFSSNPVRVIDLATDKPGWHCVKQGPECDHCYAETLNLRWGTRRTYTADNDKQVRWVLIERELAAWRKYEAAVVAGKKPPAKMFPGDMLDLFHKDIPDSLLDAVGQGVADCPHLLCLFLTKRARRGATVMQRWVARHGPLSNLGFGVSCGTQDATWRLRYLRDVQAAWRFISYEPALEAVDFGDHLDAADLLVCGGESGNKARPLDLGWARSAREQCRNHGMAFFFKQVGGRTPTAGGRLLDGQEYNEFPTWEMAA
jgi:protein gp37